jgi:hypothetical protein
MSQRLIYQVILKIRARFLEIEKIFILTKLERIMIFYNKL